MHWKILLNSFTYFINTLLSSLIETNRLQLLVFLSVYKSASIYVRALLKAISSSLMRTVRIHMDNAECVFYNNMILNRHPGIHNSTSLLCILWPKSNDLIYELMICHFSTVTHACGEKKGIKVRSNDIESISILKTV